MTNNNILYLREMGMNDENITTDIKNHRVRVVENIDIFYNGRTYNMFFEFMQCTRYKYRTENKRTGAPLKKAIQELVHRDGLAIDTEYSVPEKTTSGFVYDASYRCSTLEKEFWEEYHAFTKKDILEVVNRYSLKKYSKIVLIETEAEKIINEIGGYREKDIIKKRDFQTDGDFYFTLENMTWNDNHKVVKACRREWEPTKDARKLVITDTCEVDLITGKITG